MMQRINVQNKVEFSVSHTPAHDVTATVAPFRAWRGLQLTIAGGPTKPSIAHCQDYKQSWQRGRNYGDIQTKFQLEFKS